MKAIPVPTVPGTRPSLETHDNLSPNVQSEGVLASDRRRKGHQGVGRVKAGVNRVPPRSSSHAHSSAYQPPQVRHVLSVDVVSLTCACFKHCCMCLYSIEHKCSHMFKHKCEKEYWNQGGIQSSNSGVKVVIDIAYSGARSSCSPVVRAFFDDLGAFGAPISTTSLNLTGFNGTLLTLMPSRSISPVLADVTLQKKGDGGRHCFASIKLNPGVEE
eukprot:TRINITY_DN75999_c0_g1_i1.p1 TRINITY_DN75999_c0_g1~~TRINITY_DN75999_c0_g1_i1.p1  ORF type:complete len:215 (+),score=11.90 TRINITY_DN75999_c0_g1_i1:223-867(+)